MQFKYSNSFLSFIIEFYETKGITSIKFTPKHQFIGYPEPPDWMFKEFNDFFNKKKTKINIPISLKGTKFELMVWKALMDIPYGKTRSYSDIAYYIKKPSAFRAVANACGKNPIPIIVPCHRVIRKNGNIGGYSAGINIKRLLLNLEMR